MFLAQVNTITKFYLFRYMVGSLDQTRNGQRVLCNGKIMVRNNYPERNVDPIPHEVKQPSLPKQQAQNVK